MSFLSAVLKQHHPILILSKDEAIADFIRIVSEKTKQFGYNSLMPVLSMFQNETDTVINDYGSYIQNHLCPGCFDEISKENTLSFEPCGHLIHFQCCEELVNSYFNQGKQYPFKCPVCVSINITKTNTNTKQCGVLDTRGNFKKVQEFLWSSKILPVNKYVKCPNPMCSLIIKIQSDKIHGVKCSCNTTFCHKCREDVHPDLTCIQYRKVNDIIAELKEIQNDETIHQWLAYKYGSQFGFELNPKWHVIERYMSSNNIIKAFDSNTSISKSFNISIETVKSLIVKANEICSDDDIAPYLPLPDNHPLQMIITNGHPYAKFNIEESEESDESMRSKFCPKCYVTIGKIDGCPSIKCPVCNYFFCYTCLGPQHTHSECKESINYTELRNNANSADALKSIDKLIYFSPELELAEQHNLINNNTKYLKEQRRIRHISIYRYKWIVEALLESMKDNSNSNSNIVKFNEYVHNLQYYIDIEENQIKKIMPHLIDSSLIIAEDMMNFKADYSIVDGIKESTMNKCVIRFKKNDFERTNTLFLEIMIIDKHVYSLEYTDCNYLLNGMITYDINTTVHLFKNNSEDVEIIRYGRISATTTTYPKVLYLQMYPDTPYEMYNECQCIQMNKLLSVLHEIMICEIKKLRITRMQSLYNNMNIIYEDEPNLPVGTVVASNNGNIKGIVSMGIVSKIEGYEDSVIHSTEDEYIVYRPNEFYEVYKENEPLNIKGLSKKGMLARRAIAAVVYTHTSDRNIYIKEIIDAKIAFKENYAYESVNDIWQCPKCTLINEIKANNCIVCNNEKNSNIRIMNKQNCEKNVQTIINSLTKIVSSFN